MTKYDMMRNFGVVYMKSYKYAYYLLPEHTKRKLLRIIGEGCWETGALLSAA